MVVISGFEWCLTAADVELFSVAGFHSSLIDEGIEEQALLFL